MPEYNEFPYGQPSNMYSLDAMRMPFTMPEDYRPQPVGLTLVPELLDVSPALDQQLVGPLNDCRHAKIEDLDPNQVDEFATRQIELAELISIRAGDGRSPAEFIGNPDSARDALVKAGLLKARQILLQRQQKAARGSIAAAAI